MFKGFYRPLIGEVPTRGLLMLLLELARVSLEGLQEKIGEQRVIAKPLALVVRCNHEQVGPLQCLDHRLAVVATCDGIAQGWTESCQDAGL
ncbi:hypothetical protein D3C84_797630 [compost metagenome]